MKTQLHYLLFAGWLFPTGVALVFMGRWIREILVPTLKGGNFEQLYDLHGTKYLDVTLLSGAIGFIWLTIAVLQWLTRHVDGRISDRPSRSAVVAN